MKSRQPHIEGQQPTTASLSKHAQPFDSPFTIAQSTANSGATRSIDLMIPTGAAESATDSQVIFSPNSEIAVSGAHPVVESNAPSLQESKVPIVTTRSPAQSPSISFQDSKKLVTAAESVAECPLFKLPAELRNTIYGYVVAVDDKYGYHYENSDDEESEDGDGGGNEYRWQAPITIATEGGIPEPPLLATCKTIRAEAIGLFYETYYVHVNIQSLDPTPLVLWRRKHDCLIKQYGLSVKVTYYSEMLGGRSRENLDIWLRRIHQRLLCEVQDTNPPIDLRYLLDETIEVHLVHGMMRIAKTMRNRPWGKVKQVLGPFYEALKDVDEEWE